MTTKNVLILFAHPSQHRSEINFAMFNAAKKIQGVTCVDLYGEYPTFNININREQKRLLTHDVIIFQFPLYWYSTPAILKEWQDLVLEYGFAYGNHGTALKDKVLLCILSAGGREDAYKAGGYNNFTIRELLAPIEQMAELTKMIYVPPFALFGARTALEDKRLKNHIDNYKRLVIAFTEDRVAIEKTQDLVKVNSALDNIIIEPYS